MKNRKFIREDYPKACRYCETGRLSFDGAAVLCHRKGVLSPDDACSRFVYDPLKREPKRPAAPAAHFQPEDFSL